MREGEEQISIALASPCAVVVVDVVVSEVILEFMW